MTFLMLLGLVIVFIVGLCGISSMCLNNNKSWWVAALLFLVFWGGLTLFGLCLSTQTYEDGAKDILSGKIEPHYIYKDSVCIDTVIELKKK